MILPEALVSVLVGPSCGAKSCRFCGGAWSLEHIVRLLCPLCRWGFVMFTWSPSRICHVSGQAACYGQLVSLPAANFLTASQTVIAGLVSWAAVSVVLLCSFIVGCAHSSSLQCSLVGIRPIPIPMWGLGADIHRDFLWVCCAVVGVSGSWVLVGRWSLLLPPAL